MTLAELRNNAGIVGRRHQRWLMRFDVVVLGDGPAALAAAAACSKPGSPWRASSRQWHTSRSRPLASGSTSWPGSTWTPRVLHTWDDVHVVTNQVHQPESGVRLARRCPARELRLLEHAGGATVVRGRAVGANHDRWQSTVVLHDARLVDAIVVVDASGPWPALVHRSDERDEPRPRPRSDEDHGRCRGALLGTAGPAGACVLMDWSAPGDAEVSWSSSFDLGGRSVAPPRDGADVGARPRPPLGSARANGSTRGGGHVEVVRDIVVPLGLPIPSGRQRSVGFGAAAAMADPMTGWSIGSLLHAAPRLAQAIVAALDRRATPAGGVGRRVGAVWPAERRRARAVELASCGRCSASTAPGARR